MGEETRAGDGGEGGWRLWHVKVLHARVGQPRFYLRDQSCRLLFILAKGQNNLITNNYH